MKLAEKANTAQFMEQMQDLETRINKQLQDRSSHKEMDEALVSYAEITTTIKQDLTSEMSEVKKTLKEAREQAEEEFEKPKNNIIVYRMPESTADSVETRRKEDHNTRSSSYVTLIKPSSSLKVTHRSFRHASPDLWNQLPTSLRIPHPNHSSSSQRPSFEHAGLTCYTLLSPSITFSLFHSELKTYLFRKSYPPP